MLTFVVSSGLPSSKRLKCTSTVSTTQSSLAGFVKVQAGKQKAKAATVPGSPAPEERPSDAKLAECLGLILDKEHVDQAMAAVLSTAVPENLSKFTEQHLNYATVTGACKRTLAFVLKTRRDLFSGMQRVCLFVCLFQYL